MGADKSLARPDW